MEGEGLPFRRKRPPALLGLLSPGKAHPKPLPGEGQEEALGAVHLEEVLQGGAGGARQGALLQGGGEGGGVQGQKDPPPEGEAVQGLEHGDGLGVGGVEEDGAPAPPPLQVSEKGAELVQSRAHVLGKEFQVLREAFQELGGHRLMLF